MTNHANVPPLLVPVNQAATSLGVSRATAWRMVNAGTLDTVRVGSRRLVKLDSIERVAAQGAKTAAAG